MPLTRAQKDAFIENTRTSLENAQSILLADCSGVDSNTMNKIRGAAREKGVNMFVTYNVITKRAISGTQWEFMTDSLKGPTLMAVSYEAPGDAARLFKDFVSDHPEIEVKSIALDGENLPSSDLERVAKLPNLHEALCILAATLNSPATQVAMALNDSVARLARVLNAVAERKLNLNYFFEEMKNG